MGGGGVLLGDGGGAGHRPGGALPAGGQEEEEGQAEAEQDQVETRTLSGGYCSTTVSDIRYPGYLQISTQRERGLAEHGAEFNAPRISATNGIM